ncbi:hypothetical protein LCGC14_1814610 [marine sediment metagenome]|uniref:Uncharacterized protein n=1 Tax=marine sediment metagenome TaxID=412755 RepID=A0A0F9GKL2_9ZZZZ
MTSAALGVRVVELLSLAALVGLLLGGLLAHWYTQRRGR